MPARAGVRRHRRARARQNVSTMASDLAGGPRGNRGCVRFAVHRPHCAPTLIQSRSACCSRCCSRSNIAPISSAPQWRVSIRNFSRNSSRSSGCSGVPLKSATERLSARPFFNVTVTFAASGVGAILGDGDGHALGQRPDQWIPQRRFIEGARIARVAGMRKRHAEWDRVLRHHDVGRGGDVVDSRHLVVAGDVDRGDIVAAIAVLGAQIQNRLHRGVRGDVAGKSLEHDRARGVAVAEAAGERRRIERAAAEHPQEAELAFEHARRTGKTVSGEARREHAALGRAPEVEALHHRAAAGAGEFHEPAGERAGNAQARCACARRRNP